MTLIVNDSGINPDKLTAGSLLARNTIFSLIGQFTPLLIAIFAFPLLIKGLGKERFAVLTLVWVITGYFSLFDLGLGRAMTLMIAERLGSQQHQEIPALFWTTLSMMLFLGLIGAAILAPFCSWLVGSALKIPAVLQSETIISLYLVIFTLPIIINIPTLRGVLEAHQRFDITSIINVATGIYTLLAPLFVLMFSHHLVPIVAVLVLGRLLTFGVILNRCVKLIPALGHGIKIEYRLLRSLFGIGGWMTVTNVLGPLMVYVDRFVIGALISMTAVAFYVSPYELVTKLLLFPGALLNVLFPAFSTSYLSDRQRTLRLYQRGVKYIFLALFPVSLLLVSLSFEGLNLWLGPEFARNSTRVVQWLAVGVFINSLTFVPFGLIQGAGRPDITAKAHIVELPIYLLVLWWLIKAYGIEGAAIAWVLRVMVDASLLFFLAQRLLPVPKEAILQMALMVVAALSLFVCGSLLNGLISKGFFLLFSMAVFLVSSWILIIGREEMAKLVEYGKNIISPIFKRISK